MRFQLERDESEDTLVLFQDIVQQSRRLHSLQTSLVTFAARDRDQATAGRGDVLC